MSTIRCPECNLVNWASDVVCKRCGLAFQPMEPAADYATQPEAPVEFAGQETPIATSEPSALPPPEHEWRTSARVEPASHRYPPNAQKPKVGLAVFSMIFGIIGIPPFSTFAGVAIGGILAIAFGAGGFVAGLLLVLAVIPAGLIAGIVSLRRSKRLPEQYGGKGFAIAGIVCSSLALVVLPVIAAIAIPNLMASRRAANEGSAISTVRKLADAEDILMAQLSKGHCGDLQTLIGMSLMDNSLEKGQKSGYRFMISNFPEGGCEIHAMPLSSSHGNRSFLYSTKDGHIRAASKDGKPADKNDPALDPALYVNDRQPTKIALQKSR